MTLDSTLQLPQFSALRRWGEATCATQRLWLWVWQLFDEVVVGGRAESDNKEKGGPSHPPLVPK